MECSLDKIEIGVLMSSPKYNVSFDGALVFKLQPLAIGGKINMWGVIQPDNDGSL
jgi:hypothetical protein